MVKKEKMMVKRRIMRGNGNANGDGRVRKPRMKWTDDLHQCFLHAIAVLGEDYATPKLISQVMGIKGVTTLHIKSHLQLYRNSRQKSLIQGVVEAAESDERNKLVLNRINDVLHHPAPHGRRPRLRRIKDIIAGNEPDNHYSSRKQPPMKPAGESGDNTRTIHVPRKEDQTPHAFIIKKYLFQRANTQGKTKDKEKQYHPATEVFHNTLVKQCQSNWGSSLSLKIVTPAKSAPNPEDCSLSLSL